MARSARTRNIRIAYLRKFDIEPDEYFDRLEDELEKIEEREYLERETHKRGILKAEKLA